MRSVFFPEISPCSPWLKSKLWHAWYCKPHQNKLQSTVYSRVQMTLELLIHQYVITLFSKMQCAVLMLWQNVTVCPTFNHKPHYIRISSFTSLCRKWENRRMDNDKSPVRTEHNIEVSRSTEMNYNPKLFTIQETSLGICSAHANTTLNSDKLGKGTKDRNFYLHETFQKLTSEICLSSELSPVLSIHIIPELKKPIKITHHLREIKCQEFRLPF